MLTKLEIENFKSIHKESIDLGRVNVFCRFFRAIKNIKAIFLQ